MRLAFAIAAATLALAASARADQLVRAPEVPKPKTLTSTITDNVNGFSDELGFHIGRLTSDLVAVGFDVSKHTARVRLGGESERFALRIRSDILVQGGAARIDAAVHLRVLDRRLDLDVPTFEIAPTHHLGDRHVQLSVPVIHHRF